MQDNLNNISIRRSQARNLFLARNYVNAEKILKSIIAENPNLDDKNFLETEKLLGTLYIRTQDYEKSLQIWQEIVNRFPKDVEALTNLGNVYRHLKQHNKSIQVLKEAQDIAGENETVLFNLGSIYKDAGDYEKAITAFQKLVKLKPDDALAYNYLGSAYLVSGDKVSASFYYKKGLQVDPNHPYLNYNLANIYKEEKAFTEALAFYNVALRVNPNWADVLHNIAEIYKEEGNISEAINFEKAIIKTEGETERACVTLGGLYLKINDEIESEKYYKKALLINPKSEKAVLEYSKYLIEKKQIAEALKVLNKAKNAGTESDEVLLLYANTCLQAKDFATAKELVQKLYQKNKNSIEVLKLYGKLLSFLGQKENAENIFLQILSKFPSEINLRLDLANQYYDASEYKNAANQFEKYLVEKPNDNDARILLGKSYENLKNFDKAQKQYKTVLDNEPNNIIAMAAMSEFLQAHGNILDAVMMTDKMINLQSASSSKDDLENLAESLRLYEKATKKFSAQKKDKPIFLKRESNKPKVTKVVSRVIEEEDSFSLPPETLDKVSSDLNIPFDDFVELCDEKETWKKDDRIEEHTLKDIVDVDLPLDLSEDNIRENFAAMSGDLSFANPAGQSFIPSSQSMLPQAWQSDDFVLPSVEEEPQFARTPENESLVLSGTEPDIAREENTFDLLSDDEINNAKMQAGFDGSMESENAKRAKADDQLAKQAELIDSLNEKLNEMKFKQDEKRQTQMEDQLSKQSELIDSLNEKLGSLNLPQYGEDENVKGQLSKQSELIDSLNEKLSSLNLPEYNGESYFEDEESEGLNYLGYDEDVLSDQKKILNHQAETLDELKDIADSFDKFLSLGKNENAQVEKPKTLEDILSDDGIDLSDIDNIPTEPIAEFAETVSDDSVVDNVEVEPIRESAETIFDDSVANTNNLGASIDNDNKVFLPQRKKLPVGNIKSMPNFEKALVTISSTEMLQLFKALRDLMTVLPPEESKKFLVSTERVKMQYIIEKLKGSVGLRMRAIFMQMRNFLMHPKCINVEEDITVKKMLTHLKNLAEDLPDKGFSEACISKLDKIIENLE
ncbi:MAG: tetratricopeptide repeat protein [Treponemataceae bacterium]